MGHLKADLFMQAYNSMAYDAFTPGEIDLSFGVGNLIAISKKASFPFLAANLVQAKSQTPVFKPYIIKDSGGVKVGILGLVSKRYELGDPPEEQGKYSLQDPVAVAKKLVPQLKKKCPVIVVLAHMDLNEQEALIHAVPGIHILIGGHRPNPMEDPIQIVDTQAFVAGKRGEHLGKVDFSLEEKKVLAQFQSIPLDKQIADNPKMSEMISRYKENLNNLLHAHPPAESRNAGNGSPASKVPAVLSYIGDQSCQSCHQPEYQQWLTTAHARAFDTLVKQEKSSDLNCLACHTTGFASVKAPEAHLENVQCEACHGPGEGHPEKRKKLSAVTQSLCLKCHNTANSPNFDYPLYREKIEHEQK